MGFYLNPGNQGFWESIRSNIYVDKTGLIACTSRLLNTKEKFICLSCGCDSRELFSGLRIESDPDF